MSLLQTFSTFFILAIIYLLFNHKPTRVKENTCEEIKSGVLRSDLSDHYPIVHYPVIRVNRLNSQKKYNNH